LTELIWVLTLVVLSPGLGLAVPHFLGVVIVDHSYWSFLG
jgi:hypothetical protein